MSIQNNDDNDVLDLGCVETFPKEFDPSEKIKTSVYLPWGLVLETRLHPLGTSRLIEKLLKKYFEDLPF